jgi:hypothetical protein
MLNERRKKTLHVIKLYACSRLGASPLFDIIAIITTIPLTVTNLKNIQQPSTKMANYGYGGGYSTTTYGAQGGVDGGFLGGSQAGSQDSPGGNKV